MDRLRGTPPMIWNLIKKFLFSLDAEAVHRATAVLVRIGIRLGGVPLRIASGAGDPASVSEAGPDGRPHMVFGMEFRSRVGLAAGFDKDAEMLRGLPDLGFGFVEIGTVTPRPQPGNDRPRLFRDPSREAIFNRMGFNGLGASVVSARLRRIRESGCLPDRFRVGANIGKNKDTSNEDSARDYELAARAFEGLADYMVINVSSPNTPGLRSLQTLESLKPIIDAVQRVIGTWTRRPPLLLKLAPEIAGESLTSLLAGLEPLGIDGWVLTNTLGGKHVDSSGVERAGGWSGGPLVGIARDRLIEARAATRLPIISVGGIMTGEEAARRIELGADLIQLYSGWIYRGPRFPASVVRAVRGVNGARRV